MSRFKFRVWDKKRKKMCYCKPLEFVSVCLPKANIKPYKVEGQVYSPSQPRDEDTYDKSDEQFVNYNQEDFVIQQWTGFVDVDGKDIYEGDIITTMKYHVGGRFMHVQYYNGSFSFGSGYLFSSMSKYMYDMYGFKVTGNIYEENSNAET